MIRLNVQYELTPDPFCLSLYRMGLVKSGVLLCLVLLSVATNASRLPGSSYLPPSGQGGSQVQAETTEAVHHGALQAAFVATSEGSYEHDSGRGRDDLDALQNVEAPHHSEVPCYETTETRTMTDLLTNTMTFYQTTWSTTLVPSLVYYQTDHYVTETHTKTITDSYYVTALSTLYSSVTVTETHSQIIPAQTFHQTHTTTVTDIEWTSSTMELTMTHNIMSTIFETVTNTTSTSTSSLVPHYESSYLTMKPATSTIVNVHTSLATQYFEVAPFTDLKTSTEVVTSFSTLDVVVSPQTSTFHVIQRTPEYHYRTITVYYPSTVTKYHKNIIVSTDVALSTETVMYTLLTTRTNLFVTTVTSSKDIISESATVHTTVITNTSVTSYLETVSTTSTTTHVVTETLSSAKQQVDRVSHVVTTSVTVVRTPPPVIHTVTEATEVCTKGTTYTYYK